MSDYLKGYNSRNQRRRASQRRRRSADKYAGYNRSGMYLTRDRYGSRRRRKRSAVSFVVSRALVVILALAVLTAIFYIAVKGVSKWKKEKDTNPVTGQSKVVNVVTADAVSAEAVKAIPGGVSETVAAVSASVGAISADSFAAPTPAPRTKAVALTFDDGPSTVNTPKVLKVLKKYNAHATFFIVGQRVAEGKDLLKQELELGCELANHSWDHADLSKLTIKQVNKQYDRTAKAIEDAAGIQVELLRPPYGAISDAMREKLKHPMIFWSVDTLDWKYHDGKKELKAMKKEVSDGAIILMHDIHAESADGAERIIKWLQKNDYDVLTVSELMERNGIKMENGKVYATGK